MKRFWRSIFFSAAIVLFLNTGCESSVGVFGYRCLDIELVDDKSLAQKSLPNVILIVTDDLGYNDFDLYSGGSITIGPGMQALINDGYVFNRAYVTSSVCAPSRAGLITGAHQNSFGFVSNITDKIRNSIPSSAYGLPTNQVTIANRIKPFGYKTGLIGKWHLGEHEMFHPLNFGFDHFFGFLNGKASYRNPFISMDNNPPAFYCDYITDLLTDATINFVNRNIDSPFFAYLSYSAPHTPHEAKSSAIGDAYSFILSNLDENISRLISHLKDVGAYDNTLIIFINDNGCPSNSGSCNNGIFKGSKATAYEGGIRIPFVMKPPKQLTNHENGIIEHAVSTLDIAPTICHLIGGCDDDGSLQGISLLKQIEPGFEQARTLYFNSAIIKGDYKFIKSIDELYDLSNDPMEASNLVGIYPNIADSLANEHIKWSARNPPKLW
ncbi:sulfatase-like hydrolase/transferase [Ekhidna sp.]